MKRKAQEIEEQPKPIPPRKRITHPPNQGFFESILRCPDKQRLGAFPDHKWILAEPFSFRRFEGKYMIPICDENKNCNHEFVVNHRWHDRLDETEKEELQDVLNKEIECSKQGICPEVLDAWMCPSIPNGAMIRHAVHNIPDTFLTGPAESLTRQAFLKKKLQGRQKGLSTITATQQVYYPLLTKDRQKQRLMNQQRISGQDFQDFLGLRYFDRDWEPRLELLPYIEPTDAQDVQLEAEKKKFLGKLLSDEYPIEYREWKHKPDANLVHLPLGDKFVEIEMDLKDKNRLNQLIADPDLVFNVDFLQGWLHGDDKSMMHAIYRNALKAIYTREVCIVAYLNRLLHNEENKTPQEILASPVTMEDVSKASKGRKIQLFLKDEWIPLASRAAQKLLAPIFLAMTPKKVEELKHSQKFLAILDNLKLILGETRYTHSHPSFTAIVLLDEKNKYVAHVYVWNHYKKIVEKAIHTCEMMGIRSSLRNILSTFLGLPHIRDIASYLAEGARRWCALECAKTRNDTCQLRVVKPFGPMPDKLLKMGFENRSESKENPKGKIGTYSIISPNYDYDQVLTRFLR